MDMQEFFKKRVEVHMDHGDQKVVEVPCEKIPGAVLGAFVKRVHGGKVWHLVETEAESDGQIIGEVGKIAYQNVHAQNMPITIDGSTQKKHGDPGLPLPPMHKYHVKLHEHRHAEFVQHLGAAVP